jgi:hypothetical protein
MKERLLELILNNQAKIKKEEKKKADELAKALLKKRRDRLYELTHKADEDLL